MDTVTSAVTLSVCVSGGTVARPSAGSDQRKVVQTPSGSDQRKFLILRSELA